MVYFILKYFLVALIVFIFLYYYVKFVKYLKKYFHEKSLNEDEDEDDIIKNSSRFLE